MKYKKCEKCGLNYVLAGETQCEVCNAIDANTLNQKVLCPFCLQKFINEDEIMCKNCMKQNDIL